jgi:hypothetical protein
MGTNKATDSTGQTARKPLDTKATSIDIAPFTLNSNETDDLYEIMLVRNYLEMLGKSEINVSYAIRQTQHANLQPLAQIIFEDIYSAEEHGPTARSVLTRLPNRFVARALQALRGSMRDNTLDISQVARNMNAALCRTLADATVKPATTAVRSVPMKGTL